MNAKTNPSPRQAASLSFVLLALVVPAAAQPVVEAAVNGASFQPMVAPGAVVSIFGRGLASETAVAESVPLPTVLGGVDVRVNGVPAPIYFVSPEQVNVRVPDEIEGDWAAFAVSGASGESRRFTALLHATAPGIFTANGDGRGEVLLLDSRFELVQNPAPGDRLIVYATGLGAVAPVAGPGAPVVAPVSLFVGGRPAVVEYAGSAPGFPGVYQINFIVPDSPNGDRMQIVAGGRSSNAASFPAAGPEPVQGSGVLVTQTREVADFTRVQLVAVAKVRVQVGQPTGSLEIEAEDNLVSLIETTVEDGVLRVTAARPYWTNEGPTITVGASTLEGIEVLGVGGVEASGVFGESLHVRLSGVGDVQATGAVDSLDVIAGGVGNTRLSGLSARDVRVQMFGAGNVEVNAAESLLARKSGVGILSYTGRPATLDVVGVGPGVIQEN